jgi:hypothetical protein
MRHTTISGHHVAHQMVVAHWIIAGMIAVIVVGDAFTPLALAIVTTGVVDLKRNRASRGECRFPSTPLTKALAYAG